jgi:hypothetical protein
MTLLLQFDPIGRHVVSPASRRSATGFVICISGLAVMFGWELLVALRMRVPATVLLCAAGAVVALLIIRLRAARRGDAARHSLGRSIESQPQ